MRRLFDLVLIALLLGVVGVGAYEIGHRVDRLSNQASSQDSELNGTTTIGAAGSAAARQGSHRHLTPLIVGGALLAVLAAFVLASLVGAAVRGRKRERWRAT